MPFLASSGHNVVEGIGGSHPGSLSDYLPVTVSTGTLLTAPVNDMQLYINASQDLWLKYQNLPSYLTGQGKIASTIINETDSGTFTTTANCRVYLIRNPSWSAVDTTGWTSYETGRNYLTGETNLSVFYKDITPGTYPYDNWSAMYIWDFGTANLSNNSGRIGTTHIYGNSTSTATQGGRGVRDPYNYGTITYSIVSGALPPGFSLNSSTGQVSGSYTVQGLNSDGQVYSFTIRATAGNNVDYTDRAYNITLNAPWRYRQMLTTGYMLGGYKNSALWSNVNRIVNSTDTTTNLGDGKIDNNHYKAGFSGYNKTYVLNGGTITAFDMRTEVKSNSGQNGAGSNLAAGGTTFNERTYGYSMGGGVGQWNKWQFSTETWISTHGSGYNDNQSSVSSDQRGIMWGESGQTQRVLFSTDGIANMGYSAGAHGQQKGLNSKWGYGYAGNEGSWSGSNNYRKININSESGSGTFTRPGGWAMGEENHIMGQDWGYMLGQHDSSGQNNRSYRWNYSTDSGYVGGSTMEPKGQAGCSSGWGGWKD